MAEPAAELSPADRQEVIRERLKRVVSTHGGIVTVARLSDVSVSSLKKYLSGAIAKIPSDVVERVAGACGVPVADIMGEAAPSRPAGQAAGFGEEAVLWAGPAARRASRPLWQIRTRAVDMAGVLPGDLVDFDDTLDPEPGEVVLAQIYDDETGSAQTVVRLWRPPFLVTRSFDPVFDQAPVEADGTSTRIAGVMTSLSRSRSRT